MLCSSNTSRTFQIDEPISIDIEHGDDVCILRCKGRLASGPELEYMQERLEQIKIIACRRVLADFEEVSAIGSMGVGFLVAVYTSVIRNGGGRFVLAGARPFVRQVLEITRLDTVIPVTDNLVTGLAMLRGEAAQA